MDDDTLSRVLSNLDIGDNSIYSNTGEEQDTLREFKQEFINFLSKNPHVVTNSQFIPNKSKTLVILSPLSTRHSFGRTWVSKTYLSTIVERPQRLLATSMGIAAALSMYPAHYTLLSSTKKSPLTSPHVLKIHGKNWPADIKKICRDSEAKLSKGEVEVPEQWNSGDIYVTKTSLDALTGVIGAVETAVDSIFKDDEETPKRAFVAIRPPGHHSHPCVPSGFCLINNAHIAIEYASKSQGVTHAVILDFDLHHGDGSQDICWQKAGFEPDFGEIAAGYKGGNPDPDYHEKNEANSPKVGYFSLHDINSFPTELGYATPTNIKNASTCIMAHDLNIWNVHLQPYKDEEDFYTLYREKYSVLLQKANEFLTNSRKEHEELYNRSRSSQQVIPPFKALVVISAGFDASEYEVQTMQRHGVNVPTSFYARFTSDVVKLANKESNGVILSLLEGGYSDGALSSGVFAHLIGLQRQNWEHGWGQEEVVKELIKGCRPSWKPLKQPSTEIKSWANQVCRLGRVMVPDSIIQPLQTAPRPTPTQVPRLTRSHKLSVTNKVSNNGNMLADQIEVVESCGISVSQEILETLTAVEKKEDSGVDLKNA
jgi:histone deacetylase HOS3